MISRLRLYIGIKSTINFLYSQDVDQVVEENPNHEVGHHISAKAGPHHCKSTVKIRLRIESKSKANQDANEEVHADVEAYTSETF